MNKEFINLLENRHSVRRFTDQKVESEKIEAIIKAVLTSPSSKNTRPWDFYIVENPEIIASLSQSKSHGCRFLKDAPLAIVVTGDQNKTDIWVEDCSIASTIIQLEADAIGLGSCWVQVHGRYKDEQQTVSSEQYVHELLDIPSNRRVLNIIAIGYDLGERKGHEHSGDEDKITYIK